MFDPEAAARQLEAHDEYKVLRRLQPRPVALSRPLAPGERLAVVVDTETTGLDHRHDEVIELGMVAFVHDADGAVLEVARVFNALQEPSRPIGPEITRLTDITDAMVEGQRIDIHAVEAFLEAADLISDGRCEVLGMDVGPSEAETFWTDFLRKLDRRGLRNVKLVISDAHEGIEASVAKVMNATWQRCRVHYMRNVLAHVGRSGRRVVSAFIATAFAQDDAEAARQQ